MMLALIKVGFKCREYDKIDDGDVYIDDDDDE